MKLGIPPFFQTATAVTWELLAQIWWASNQYAGQPTYSTTTGEVQRVESAKGSMTGVLIIRKKGAASKLYFCILLAGIQVMISMGLVLDSIDAAELGILIQHSCMCR